MFAMTPTSLKWPAPTHTCHETQRMETEAIVGGSLEAIVGGTVARGHSIE